MTPHNGEATSERRRLLRDCLEGSLGQLGSDLDESQLVEYALEDAPKIFESLADEWGALRREEARQENSWRVLARRILPRRFENLDQFTPFFAGVGLRLTAIGLTLTLVSFFGPSPSRTVALLMLAAALLFLALEWVLRMAFALRRDSLDFRSDPSLSVYAAILGGASTIASSLLVVGVILLAASPALIESSTFRIVSIGLTLAGTSLPLIPQLLSADPLEFERLDAQRQRFAHALRTEALRVLRQRLNIEDEQAYSCTLTYKDFSGLAEIDDLEREVPTQAKFELLEKMKRMPGGTLGLAGTRGAGKTTLMHSICAEGSTRSKPEPPLAFVVDAPVRYDARDFVLYLFAQACTEVIGRDKVRQMRGSDRPFGFPVTNPWAFLAGNRSLLAIGCLGTGVVLMVLSLLDATDFLSSPFAWGAFLFFVGYLALVTQALADRQRRRHLDGSQPDNRSSREDPNLHTATLRLRQMWFQQSFSSGWSGGFKAPIGAEAGVSGGSELAEQQLSFPDIVDLFREFLGQVSVRREIRIGIDEMDKMDEETARRFLNEIKVAFKVPDCFFLVSISEDAMSVFERRGLPMRDVFDSSFDDVQHVPHLQFKAARELLERRTVGLSIPFLCLLHCIAGGLPRDLIRVTSALVECEESVDINDAAAQLLRRSFQAKVEGAKIVARNFLLEEHTTLLVRWLDRFANEDFAAESLELQCANFQANFLKEITDLPEEEETELRRERRELQALGTQLIAFVYYTATMLSFFRRFEDRAFVEGAIAHQSDKAPVDQMATVTQTFAVDINSAWGMLSTFRRELNLGDELEFPVLQAL
jgi:hypothetical protein